MSPEKIIAIVLLALIGVYIIGRILTKAGLHEIDNFLNKKSNKFKKEEDDNKKEK